MRKQQPHSRHSSFSERDSKPMPLSAQRRGTEQRKADEGDVEGMLNKLTEALKSEKNAIREREDGLIAKEEDLRAKEKHWDKKRKRQEEEIIADQRKLKRDRQSFSQEIAERDEAEARLANELAAERRKANTQQNLFERVNVELARLKNEKLKNEEEKAAEQKKAQQEKAAADTKHKQELQSTQEQAKIECENMKNKVEAERTQMETEQEILREMIHVEQTKLKKVEAEQTKLQKEAEAERTKRKNVEAEYTTLKKTAEAERTQMETEQEILREMIHAEQTKRKKVEAALTKQHRKAEAEQAQIKAERVQLKQQHQELEDKKKAHFKQLDIEQEQMKKAFKDSDIIYLNVAGTKTSCLRSTLTQFAPTMLSAMFSGRWEETLVKDKEGSVFLDFNVECFFAILDWLRAERLQPLSPLPNIHKDQLAPFEILVEYLGLKDIITRKQPIALHLKNNNDKYPLWFSATNQVARNDKAYRAAVIESLGGRKYEITLTLRGEVDILMSASYDTIWDPTGRIKDEVWDFAMLRYPQKEEERTITLEVDCSSKTLTEKHKEKGETKTVEFVGTGQQWMMFLFLERASEISIRSAFCISE